VLDLSVWISTFFNSIRKIVIASEVKVRNSDLIIAIDLVNAFTIVKYFDLEVLWFHVFNA
jgi:hypothetical protein